MMRNFIRSFETLTILLQQVQSDSSVRSCWTCQNRCCRGCCDSESNPNLVFLFLNFSLGPFCLYIAFSFSLHTTIAKPKHALCSLSSFFFPHTLFYKSDSDYALLTQIQQSKQTTHFWASLFLFDFYFFALILPSCHSFGEVRKKQHKTDSFFFFGNFSCDSSLCWTWCSRKPQKYFVLQLQFGVEEFRVNFCD